MSCFILFDDDEPGLSPLCDLRASFELRTGALTTLERLREQIGRDPDSLVVSASMAALVGERFKQPVNELPEAERYLFVNGRWSSIAAELPDQVNAAVMDEQGGVLAALLDRPTAEAFVASGCRRLDNVQRQVVEAGDSLLRRPWHVLAHAVRNLEPDLAMLTRRMKPLDAADAGPGVTIVGEHRVWMGRDSVVHPHVVFDTSAGPIVIDDGAEVRSMGVVVGPGYIGRGTVITNHAHIRGRCVIGPVCKVGGEVNACVFQGHSNKAHSGYLGNSYIGEWVNLGADTVTSNLKNTYGPVRMQCRSDTPPEDTGMTHLGSVIADHVKTAIGTRLQTGSCIQTGAMLAVSTFPAKCVARFAFITDGGEQRYDFEKFCEVAEAMMSRREQRVTAGLRQRLRELYS